MANVAAKEKVKRAVKVASEAATVAGMADILPKDGQWWEFVYETGRHLSKLYDFHFIETPLLETPGLFLAGIGEKPETAMKKLFALKTPEGEDVALRPDLSAPMLRSYIGNHLGYFASPLKVYHTGSVFRCDSVKDGVSREVRQWGFDIIGDNDPVYDMQVLLAALEFLKLLKFKDLKVKISSVGCKVCRGSYREKLRNYYKKHKTCAGCADSLADHPMRLLKCQGKECVPLRDQAPIIFDHLCQPCNNHFKAVLELIEDNGILYEPDPHFSREKEYYNRTVFEIYSNGYEHALAGGGRYDYLSEILFKKQIPGVGVALGLDRIVEQIKKNDAHPVQKGKKVFFVAVGDQAKKMSIRLMDALRTGNVHVVEALGKKTFKAQMKFGERVDAAYTLILGQKEAFEGSVIIRDAKTGAQETLVAERLVEEVKKRLKEK